MTQHEMYSQSEQKLTQINEILAAYPYYVEAQAIDAKLKPLTQELLTLEAATNQALTLSKQLSEAKSFEQQIGTFRQLLEQRSQMITTLSTAYSKYTSWLYPEKVGPAIQTAVNDVLNSIALPRPITLEGEWDKNNFVWYVRDGNSRPPYEKCSGAQRFFIGLAIRIALGRLGSSNMINDQIFIDEGFTACDAETMDRVPSLLNNLLKDSNKLNAVFMVSHLEQLKSAAAASIPIYRGATSSKLTVGERHVAPKGSSPDDQPKKVRGRPTKKSNTPTIQVADA
jgi:DNA repair exonuclease SbcCD ATPase subunit